MKWIDRFVILFCLMVILIFAGGLWTHFFGEDLLKATVREALEDKVKARLVFGSCEINWFTLTAVVRDVRFYRKEKQAHIGKLTAKLKIPNFFTKYLPIDELLIENADWLILKIQRDFKFFPDFVTSTPDVEGEWNVHVDKIIFRNYRIFFDDNDMDVPVDFTFVGSRAIIVIDPIYENVLIKGYLSDLSKKDSEYYLNLKLSYHSRLPDFSIIFCGRKMDFSVISPYQFQFTKLQIKQGEGSCYFDIENHLGLLKGYIYVDAYDLHFAAFNESIFSTVLGLSYQSFLGMIEQNNDHLSLDFMIYGSDKQPSIRLGNLSSGFLLKAPVSIAKDAVGLVEKVFNTALLGIPRKIFKAAKNKGDKSGDSSEPVPEESQTSTP